MPTIDKTTIISNLITCLITATAMIIVSYIGILPDLKSKEPPVQTYTVNGTVFKDSTFIQALDGIEIFLFPASGSDQVTNTDDKGIFKFECVKEKNWWIIARDPYSTQKPSCKYQLDFIENTGTVKLSGAYIRYSILKN
jgi:hypothetical protein